jgi:ubiquinone/menaquinone biosynthesis C-methylase UbiE
MDSAGTGNGQDARDGVLGVEYAEARTQSRALRYRLWRRTQEVREAIRRHADAAPQALLDCGTADGRMLRELQEAHPGARCVGVEYDAGLAALARGLHPELEIRQGDVQALDLPGAAFDVTIACAVIEHVSDPARAFAEMRRVTRARGLAVLTAPDPFWERIATALRLLPREQHHEVMDLSALSRMAERQGWQVVATSKFMLSPIGLPFERAVEGLVRGCGLSCLMANQLLVLRAV